MRRRTILAATIPACLLAACGGSTGSADLRVEPPDAAVMQPCARPARLAGAETAREQEALWRRDRLALARCGDRHATAVAWIEGVVTALAGD